MRDLCTELSDRVLRFDGVSICEVEALSRFLLLGSSTKTLRANESSEELTQFNDLVSEDERIRVAALEPVNLDFRWRLPDEYLHMDLNEYVIGAFLSNCPKEYTPEQQQIAATRIDAELQEIEKRGMVEFMKTVIYILDEFRKQNVIWGVGRGSSCASYVLFVLGLHMVDCVKYNVPMSEFFHD